MGAARIFYIPLRGMDTQIIVRYLGDNRTEATHPSGQARYLTQAGAPAGEVAQAYNPVEQLCMAGAACVLITLGKVAGVHGFSVDGAWASVSFTMRDKPRMLQTVRLEIHLPEGEYSPKQRRILQLATKECPVMLSLNENISKEVEFVF